MVETWSPRFHRWFLSEVPKQSRLRIPQDNPCLRAVISFIRCLLKQQSKGLTKLYSVETNPLQAKESDAVKAWPQVNQLMKNRDNGQVHIDPLTFSCFGICFFKAIALAAMIAQQNPLMTGCMSDFFNQIWQISGFPQFFMLTSEC